MKQAKVANNGCDRLKTIRGEVQQTLVMVKKGGKKEKKTERRGMNKKRKQVKKIRSEEK